LSGRECGGGRWLADVVLPGPRDPPTRRPSGPTAAGGQRRQALKGK
jgi:hypothetical protein